MPTPYCSGRLQSHFAATFAKTLLRPTHRAQLLDVSDLFYSIGTGYVERAYFVLGSSAEDAPPRTRLPSSKATLLAFTKFEPSLARDPLTWTTSPTFKEFRVQPCRIRPFG